MSKPINLDLGNSYTEDSIRGTNNSIKAVRDDASRYLGSLGTRAILQMLREIVENSIDEESLVLGKFITDPEKELEINVKLFPDGSARVKDQGRGIPVGLKDIEEDTPQGLSKVKLADFYINSEGTVHRRDFKGDKSISEVYMLPDEEYIAYTAPLRANATFVVAPEYQRRVAPVIIHAMENDTFGGKGKKGSTSENDAYKGSRTGGVHGAGMCVTLACCDIFEVVNTFVGTGQTYTVKYAKGERVEQFKQLPTPILGADGKPDYGFQVTFKPDLTVLNLYDDKGKKQDYPYDIPTIDRLFRNYVLACERININLEYQLPGDETVTKVSYKSSEMDAVKILEKLSKSKDVLSVDFSGQDFTDPINPIDYELHMDITVSSASTIRCLVNRLMTSKSSVNTSLLSTLEEVLHRKFQKSGCLNPNVPLELDLERYYVGAILSLGVNNPEFSGQVKSEYHSPRLSSLLNVKFHEYFSSGDGTRYINQLYSAVLPHYNNKVKAYLDGEKDKKSKELNAMKEKARKSTAPNKRTNFPIGQSISDCFLLIVEGDSGATHINSILESGPKNIKPLFGTFKLRGKLFNILTGDITTSNDQEMLSDFFNSIGPKYPWKRIVCFTDGDVDGQHIRDLTSALMCVHASEIIRHHRFSFINTPLCKVRIKCTVDKDPRGYFDQYIFTQDALKKCEATYGEKGSNTLVSKISYKGIAELDERDLEQLLEIDAYGNLRYEYIVKPVDPNNLDAELKTLEKYFGEDTSFRKQYIETTFMTSKYSKYLATRAERMSDLGIKLDLSSLTQDAQGHYTHKDLTANLEETRTQDVNYMTSVDFLRKVQSTYGADLEMLDNANESAKTGDYKL